MCLRLAHTGDARVSDTYARDAGASDAQMGGPSRIAARARHTDSEYGRAASLQVVGAGAGLELLIRQSLLALTGTVRVRGP